MKCMLNLFYREDQEMKKIQWYHRKLLHILPQVQQLIPIKRCLAIIRHILKKALKYIASCTPLHLFLEHNVDLLLKNIHLYLLNNLWIAKKPCICISSTCRYL